MTALRTIQDVLDAFDGFEWPSIMFKQEAAIKALREFGTEGEAARFDLLQWAIGRWRAEVENRPLINVHRQNLDITWRQVIRYAGGDDKVLVGPEHWELVQSKAASRPADSQQAFNNGYDAGFENAKRVYEKAEADSPKPVSDLLPICRAIVKYVRDAEEMDYERLAQTVAKMLDSPKPVSEEEEEKRAWTAWEKTPVYDRETGDWIVYRDGWLARARQGAE